MKLLSNKETELPLDISHPPHEASSTKNGLYPIELIGPREARTAQALHKRTVRPRLLKTTPSQLTEHEKVKLVPTTG